MKCFGNSADRIYGYYLPTGNYLTCRRDHLSYLTTDLHPPFCSRCNALLEKLVGCCLRSR